MGYHTKQKERILDLLKTCAGEHLTVSDLGKQLEENGTPVGTATIYRYLEQLTEEGVLRKYILDGKSSACYQYLGEHATCQEHFHLKCLSCGTLFHVQCTFLDEMQAHIAAHHHFQIDHTKTVLYGYCEQCQNAQQPMTASNEKAHNQGEEQRYGCGGNGVGIKHLQQLDIRGDHGDQVTPIPVLQLCGAKTAQGLKDLVTDQCKKPKAIKWLQDCSV